MAREEKRRGFDAMIVDFFDRDDATLAGVRWAVFQPGMYQELLLATDEQLLEAVGSKDIERGLEWIRPFPPGAWLSFKNGIAIRLGARVGADGPRDE